MRLFGKSSALGIATLRHPARQQVVHTWAPDLYPAAAAMGNDRAGSAAAGALQAVIEALGLSHRQRLTLALDIWHTSVMKAAFLPGIAAWSGWLGDDARKFLNGLLTADIGKVTPASPRFAALLTPQGKIIADFIVAEAAPADGGGFLLDCPRALVPALVERLKFSKLRVKATVEDLFSRDLGVMAIWDGNAAPPIRPMLSRPPARRILGLRWHAGARSRRSGAGRHRRPAAGPADYEAHRIALGAPSGGADFTYGDAFPHEADMDQLHGVDFDKGCFVGQEVVSRMEHRGIARTRVVPVAFDGAAPEPGVAVTAGGKPVGVMGSAAAGYALATLRLDRIDEALAAGVPLLAGEIGVRLIKPDWARFAFPGELKAAP